MQMMCQLDTRAHRPHRKSLLPPPPRPHPKPQRPPPPTPPPSDPDAASEPGPDADPKKGLSREAAPPRLYYYVGLDKRLTPALTSQQLLPNGQVAQLGLHGGAAAAGAAAGKVDLKQPCTGFVNEVRSRWTWGAQGAYAHPPLGFG